MLKMMSTIVMPHHAVLTTDGLHFLTDVEGFEQLDQLNVVLIVPQYIISGRQRCINM